MNTPPISESVENVVDFREFLRTLIRYRWVAFGTAVTVTALVAIWTIRQPRIYEAQCSLQYDPNPPRPLGRDIEDVTQPLSNFWISKEYYETQNRIIASRSIAERVVRRLHLDHDPDFMMVPKDRRARWKGATVEDAARQLQTRTTVEPVKETQLVYVKVKHPNPERAMVLTNTLVDAYLEKLLEERMGSSVSTLEWLSTQLDNLKDKLENSEHAIHNFKEQNNVVSVSLEDQRNIVSGSIQRLSERLDEARIKRIELQARLAQLEAVANQADPLEIHATAFTTNDAINALRKDYATKKSELESRSVRYGDAHPQIRSLRAELDELHAQIAGHVQGLIRSAAADLKEAQSTEQGLQSALAHANQEGLALNLREIEYRRLQREQENQAKVYNAILERTTETELTRRLRVSNVRVIDRAVKPKVAVSPRVGMNIAIGTLAGLLLGIAAVLLLATLDRTIKQTEDAEALGLTVLGIIPRISSAENAKIHRGAGPVKPQGRDLVVHSHPRSSAAECCRTIRTNLTFKAAAKPLRSLVVTSPAPREGKTTVATSLAIVMAQSGKSVLLVDSDLRRPRIHRSFGLSSIHGVTSVLVGELSLDEAVRKTEVPGLDILPCGPIPPNPAELLHTPSFQKLLADTLQKYDRVIFDSPPLGVVTDAAVMAPQVDGAVVVVQAKATTRDALRSCLRRLFDVRANLVGGVINDVDLNDLNYGYRTYYYYGGDGYYADNSSETPKMGGTPPTTSQTTA